MRKLHARIIYVATSLKLLVLLHSYFGTMSNFDEYRHYSFIDIFYEPYVIINKYGEMISVACNIDF